MEPVEVDTHNTLNRDWISATDLRTEVMASEVYHYAQRISW